MVRLFVSESHGMGVWDGEYEYTLAVEEKRINTRASKFAPPPAPERAVTFKDKALARLVVLERGVREKRKKEEWLLVILEAAQEMDLLTDALLSNLECSGQQATLSWDFQRNTMWWRCPARCERRGPAGQHWFEGEMLYWSDTINMLTIFGGQRTLTSGDTQNFVEVWIGDQGPHLISCCPDQPRPQGTAQQHATQLTWSEAVDWCTEWFKSTILVYSPSKDVTPVMKMFLGHRQEKLIMALCLAWSKNHDGRTITPSEGEYLQSIVTLQERLECLTQEKESWRSASESFEKDLKAADEKIRKEVEKNAALSEENYALKHAEKMDKRTHPLKGLIRGSRHEGSAKSSSRTNGSQELLEATQREADAYKEELSRAKAKLVHLGTAQREADAYKEELSRARAKLVHLGTAQREADAYKQHLGKAEAKLASLEEECMKLRGEVAQYRAHRLKVTSGESGVNVQATSDDLPSSINVATEVKWVSNTLINELYLEYWKISKEAQERFGKAVVDLLKGFYVLAHSHYVGMFKSMLEALGGLETISSVTRYTLEAFEVYCKTHWKGLFLNLKDDVAIPSATAIVADEAHVPSGTDNMECSASGPSDGSPQVDRSKSIQELFASFFSVFSSHSLNEKDAQLIKSVFDDLWRATIWMFLQRPHKRFCFSGKIRDSFDSKHLEFVDDPLKSGHECIVLIPPILEAPHDFTVATSSVDLENNSSWIMAAKGQADKPVSG